MQENEEYKTKLGNMQTSINQYKSQLQSFDFRSNLKVQKIKEEHQKVREEENQKVREKHQKVTEEHQKV